MLLYTPDCPWFRERYLVESECGSITTTRLLLFLIGNPMFRLYTCAQQLTVYCVQFDAHVAQSSFSLHLKAEKAPVFLDGVYSGSQRVYLILPVQNCKRASNSKNRSKCSQSAQRCRASLLNFLKIYTVLSCHFISTIPVLWYNIQYSMHTV